MARDVNANIPATGRPLVFIRPGNEQELARDGLLRTDVRASSPAPGTHDHPITGQPASGVPELTAAQLRQLDDEAG